MNKRIILSESEKNRILGIHKNAILKEWNLINEQDPVNPQSVNNEVLLQGTDTDYDYKKVGDKYYFKLKENPTSPAAKGYKTQGKFKDWTLATNQNAINKISQLPTLSKVAAFQEPKVGDGSDEKFDAPVQTVGTTTPSTYPWIENGKASFEALKKSNAADPNFNIFLGQLKTITLDQRRKILEDFKNSGITEKSEQPYLVMQQALNDSLRFPEPATTKKGPLMGTPVVQLGEKTVKWGDTIEFQFKDLKNSGNAPLTISKITPSSENMTVDTKLPLILQPGQTFSPKMSVKLVEGGTTTKPNQNGVIDYDTTVLVDTDGKKSRYTLYCKTTLTIQK